MQEYQNKGGIVITPIKSPMAYRFQCDLSYLRAHFATNSKYSSLNVFNSQLRIQIWIKDTGLF